MIHHGRRWFFVGAGGVAATLAGFGVGALVKEPPYTLAKASEPEPDIPGRDTPVEDLMREHAVLDRVMLVYEECARRLDLAEELAPDLLARAASVVRRYIEDHHERDEERHVFPRLERIGAEVPLIVTLRAQHEAGRALTSDVLRLATRDTLRDPLARARLSASARGFVRMYRPHAAHENTVLFPALRKALRQREYDALRDTLEREEHAAYGADLYEGALREVEELERALGIGDLAAFTPR
jgi:hemerythrin-like domain-containing protein